MITWAVRIIADVLCVVCFMSGHWILGIIFLYIGLGFYVCKNGEFL
jgi:hypothetical protein